MPQMDVRGRVLHDLQPSWAHHWRAGLPLPVRAPALVHNWTAPNARPVGLLHGVREGADGHVQDRSILKWVFWLLLYEFFLVNFWVSSHFEICPTIYPSIYHRTFKKISSILKISSLAKNINFSKIHMLKYQNFASMSPRPPQAQILATGLERSQENFFAFFLPSSIPWKFFISRFQRGRL